MLVVVIFVDVVEVEALADEVMTLQKLQVNLQATENKTPLK